MNKHRRDRNPIIQAASQRVGGTQQPKELQRSSSPVTQGLGLLFVPQDRIQRAHNAQC